MKLLLTSNGLENDGIYDALVELVGKPVGEIKIIDGTIEVVGTGEHVVV